MPLGRRPRSNGWRIHMASDFQDVATSVTGPEFLIAGSPNPASPFFQRESS